jgi:hypothetical protein
MKLVLLQEKLFEKRDGFKVGNQKINALQGYFEISEEEKNRVVKKAEDLWKKVLRKSGMDNFEGHIRFDFIPEFKEKAERKGSVIDLGKLSIKGIYEINTHSPEGVACDALYRKHFPELRDYTPSASKNLAESLLATYSKQITMVKGDNLAKKSWGDCFVNSLKEFGLKMEEKKPEEIRTRRPGLVWRWGDIDFKKEYNEYEDDFQKWLLKQNGAMKIINTIPKSRNDDIANKKLLAKKEDLILRDKKDLLKGLKLSKDNYVLKPLRGASGKGIVFGELVNEKEWKEVVLKAYQRGGYGLFKKIILPKIEVDELAITIDFLPAFYAYQEELTYLYSLVRVEPWESYFFRKTINVAQGGGYGGTVRVTKGG